MSGKIDLSDLSSYLTSKDIMEDRDYWRKQLPGDRDAPHLGTVIAFCRLGKLPAIKLGRQYFVRKEDWEKFKQVDRSDPYWRKKLAKRQEHKRRLAKAVKANTRQSRASS